MRLFHLLPLAALSAAFVIPDEQVLADLVVPKRQPSEEHHKTSNAFLNKPPCPHHLLDGAKSWFEQSERPKSPLDHALESIEDNFETQQHNDFIQDFDTLAWLEETALDGDEFGLDSEDGPPPPPPPHDKPPHHKPPHHRPPHHGPPHKKPHHPPHHHSPNKTIYELIAESRYTTVLAKLIANDSDLVKVLNSTKANFTLFAPTDKAFEKIPPGAPTPSKDFIKKVLLYHVSPDLYPAGRLLFSHTVPSLLNETLLGDNPQRLAARAGFRGVTINFYSKVLAVNIPATNGLIHAVDSILVPPPKTLKVLSLLPSEFSTLVLGLGKTGLIEELANATTTGGTFFAPPNGAFKKLGPRINAFLFSKVGEKYLKALLKYHVVANQTLYSNAYYGPAKSEVRVNSEDAAFADAVPYYHFDLPTLLDDKALAVDVTRFGPFITIKINGFTRVIVSDGITKDGVIQAVGNVLIPPKKLPGMDLQFWEGEEMSVQEFKERLGPFVVEDIDEATKLDL